MYPPPSLEPSIFALQSATSVVGKGPRETTCTTWNTTTWRKRWHASSAVGNSKAKCIFKSTSTKITTLSSALSAEWKSKPFTSNVTCWLNTRTTVKCHTNAQCVTKDFARNRPTKVIWTYIQVTSHSVEPIGTKLICAAPSPGEKPHSCRFCDRKFGDDANCLKHMRESHSEQWQAYKENKRKLAEFKETLNTPFNMLKQN